MSASADGLKYRCKECCKASKREWYAATAEARRAAWREKYSPENNPEYASRKRDYQRRYREKNREACNERCREWRQNNPEKAYASARRWVLNNREQVLKNARVNDWRRRARKREATSVQFSKHQLAERWEYYGGRCYLCGDVATQTDHVKPLSKGGANMLCNLRPVCSFCNNKKNNQWPYGLLKSNREAA